MPWDASSALPPMSGDETVTGIDAPVTIVRDEFGIPHIDATTVGDMFFAQGLACAQDRLWQMDYDRRRGLGTVCEILGPAGLRNDRFARRARLAQYSRENFDRLDGETQAMLAAYAAGVNAFLSSAEARPVEIQELDYEPDPWEPWHPVVAFVVRHVTFGTWLNKLFRGRVLRAFGRDAALAMRREGQPGDEVTLILPPGATGTIPATDDLDTADAETAVALLDRAFGLTAEGDGSGASAGDGGDGDSDASNSWVVAGSRTASGAPLLCGDSHRGLEIPNVYYQVHLRAPGIDCAGFAFTGIPGVPHFGHSGGAAWCVTNASAEYQDLFVERFAHDGTYEHRGQQRQADRRFEAIAVRGGPDETVECVETVHGPVVVGEPSDGAAIALRSSGLLDAGGSLRCCLPLMRAQTVAEVETVLNDWVEPANNWMAADSSGGVLYVTAGKFPKRPVLGAWLPVPGWTGDYDWDGYHPQQSMPRLADPEDGIIATANNRVAAQQPGPIAVDYAPSGRCRRAYERLTQIEAATTRDMASVHSDAVSVGASRFVQRIAQVDPGDDEDVSRAQAMLTGWDAVMDADSPAAALYEETKSQLIRLLAANTALDPIRSPLADEPPAGVVSLQTRIGRSLRPLMADARSFALPGGSSWDEALRDALRAAWTFLVAGLGDDPADWRWGRLHVQTPVHPLRQVRPDLVGSLQPPAVELSGNSECVQATISQPGVTHACVGGPVARYVFDLSDRDAGGWCSPLGSSGHPGSPNFADQQRLWAGCELVPMVTRWDAVVSAAQATQRLVPAG